MESSKHGFIVISFLIMMTISMTIHGYLCEKIILEMKLLEDLQEVNRQIQHERNLIEEVYCLIQCDHDEEIMLVVDDFEVNILFYDGFCVVSDSFVRLLIEYDEDEKVLRNVVAEK